MQPNDAVATTAQRELSAAVAAMSNQTPCDAGALGSEGQ
jgi:hypothetical protein